MCARGESHQSISRIAHNGRPTAGRLEPLCGQAQRTESTVEAAPDSSMEAGSTCEAIGAHGRGGRFWVPSNVWKGKEASPLLLPLASESGGVGFDSRALLWQSRESRAAPSACCLLLAYYKCVIDGIVRLVRLFIGPCS